MTLDPEAYLAALPEAGSPSRLAVDRLLSILRDCGVRCYRHPAGVEIDCEETPRGLKLLLRRSRQEFSDSDPLHGFRAAVSVATDYRGNPTAGKQIGRWLLWRVLYGARLVNRRPPNRPEDVEPPMQKRRGRPRRKASNV